MSNVSEAEWNLRGSGRLQQFTRGHREPFLCGVAPCEHFELGYIERHFAVQKRLLDATGIIYRQ